MKSKKQIERDIKRVRKLIVELERMANEYEVNADKMLENFRVSAYRAYLTPKHLKEASNHLRASVSFLFDIFEERY